MTLVKICISLCLLGIVPYLGRNSLLCDEALAEDMRPDRSVSYVRNGTPPPQVHRETLPTVSGAEEVEGAVIFNHVF